MSRGAQQQPVAAAGEEALQRRLGARRHRPRAQLLVALGVEQVLVERARLEDLPLLGGRRLQQPRVDLGQRVLDRLRRRSLGALDQRRQLEQLHVAHDGVGDVEVGVEAQLAEPAADLRDRRQQLVAQQPERRLQRLRGPEQLLLALLPLAAAGDPRLLGERRRVLHRAAVGALRVGEHQPRARARHRDVQQPPHRLAVRRLGVGRERLLEQRVRDRLERALARAGHARGHQPEHVDVLELQPLGGVHGHHLHADGAVARRRLLLAQPGVGDGRDRARELARGRLRGAAHVGRGELGELGEVAQPLDDLGRGGEQQLAAQAEPLDQPVHVEVGARGVDRARGAAVEAEEVADPVARLGRDLRRLERRGQRRDHVELAPARDLGHAREVDRAQLDGRARERAHDRAGVAGVDQQPQPRQQVAHLGALEERGRARQPVRHGALLEGDPDRLALRAHGAHEHADVLGRDVLARDQPLDLGRDGLRLRALGGAGPEGDLARLARPRAQRLVDPARDRLRDGRGGGDDPLARAEGLLQAHHARRGPLRLEVRERLRRGAAEAVDRLVVVARRGDRRRGRRRAAAAAAPGRSSCPAGRRRARAGSGRPGGRARAASRAAAGTRAGRGRRSRACRPRASIRSWARKSSPNSRSRAARAPSASPSVDAHAA